MRLALVLVAACLLGPLPARAEPAAETVTVLVARKDIPPGTLLKEPEKLFKEVRYAKGDEPRQTVATFEQLKGKRTLRALAEDQPVKTKDVGDGAPLLDTLPKGRRAVAIRVSAETATAGFIIPGCRVDVIHVVRKDKESTASTLMQNVLVLAVDTTADRPPSSTTVTLALTPAGAEKVRQAAANGELSLTLRAPDEGAEAPMEKTAPPVTRPGDMPPVPGPADK